MILSYSIKFTFSNIANPKEAAFNNMFLDIAFSDISGLFAYFIRKRGETHIP